MSNTTEIVKVLVIDTGKEPIVKERLDLSSENPFTVKKTILEVMNRMGKNAHALIHFKGKWFVADHTAKRGPSDAYFRTEVHYHPYMGELT